MVREEAAGLYASLTGHVLLLAALTYGVLLLPKPPLASPEPMEVSFVDEVSLVSASPTPQAVPAPSAAPQLGPVEEAAPSPAPVAAPTPAPPRPALTLRPATPQKPPDARDRRRPEESRQGRAQQSRGARLADLNLDGLGRDTPPSRANQAPGAVMNAQAAANIAQAITRQVQPCADRQVYPGPGAERIVTSLALSLNPDGSLRGRPRMTGQRGVDDENRRYAQRVADLAINAFVSCSPLRGLPRELYDVPRGWSNFTMNYRLPA
ncbi:MAG TPA: cell envelope biogenesis protein TolA [Allosphingosinicella sp.]|nr:cell envelope biogenesis protein TolA [Allosphingosinicella sp.]